MTSTSSGHLQTACPSNFVIMASTPFHGHRLYEQRLAAALGARYRVFYIEPPTHPLRAARRRADVPAGVQLVRPWTVPYGRRRALAWITGVIAAAWTWTVLIACRGTDATVIAVSMHPVTRRLLSRLATIVVVKDDYVVGADLLGADARRLARKRLLALRSADRVVVVSPMLRDSIRSEFDGEPCVIPAGCDLIDDEHATPPPLELQGVARPRAVFIGLVSDRIDFDYFAAVAASGYHVVMVGGVQQSFSRHEDLARLEAGGHVTRVPNTSAERVASFLLHSDLGLVPYSLSAFNQASFPLKTLEYLAAGLPVLGSELSALRWLDAPHVVTGPPSEVAGMIDKIRGFDRVQVAAQGRAFAACNTWAVRAAEFVTLAGVLARGRPS